LGKAMTHFAPVLFALQCMNEWLPKLHPGPASQG
jgi:hypothetical protein